MTYSTFAKVNLFPYSQKFTTLLHSIPHRRISCIPRQGRAGRGTNYYRSGTQDQDGNYDRY